eukprot:6213476-Pleurochrysis_carterae.AAC.3
MRWAGQPAHCSLVASPMRKSASCSARPFQGTDNQQAKRRATCRLERAWVAPRCRRQARGERALSPHCSVHQRRQGRWACHPISLARRITFALARGDFAPVFCGEGLQLSRRGVLCGDTSDHPKQQRGAREPGLLLRQVSDELSAGHAKAENQEGKIRPGRRPSLEERRHQKAGDGSDGGPGSCNGRSAWRQKKGQEVDLVQQPQ